MNRKDVKVKGELQAGRRSKGEKTPEVYGYVRVSTKEQNEGRQMAAMAQNQVPEENIFIDKQSGKDFNRPMYQRMLKKLRPDDVLYIKSIDRLGRNYNEILEQWRVLTKKKRVDIVVLDMPLLDTRRGKDLMGTLIADLVLALLSYVSESERHTIKSRQREGIEAAMQRGIRFGRPEKQMPENFEQIYSQWLKKELSAESAAEQCNVSISTFYRWVKKQRLGISGKRYTF